jgi:hypothetical protein
VPIWCHNRWPLDFAHKFDGLSSGNVRLSGRRGNRHGMISSFRLPMRFFVRAAWRPRRGVHAGGDAGRWRCPAAGGGVLRKVLRRKGNGRETLTFN